MHVGKMGFDVTGTKKQSVRKLGEDILLGTWFEIRNIGESRNKEFLIVERKKVCRRKGCDGV